MGRRGGERVGSGLETHTLCSLQRGSILGRLNLGWLDWQLGANKKPPSPELAEGHPVPLFCGGPETACLAHTQV